MSIEGEDKVREILLKRLGKIKKKQIEKKEGGDSWFKKHYLRDLEKVERLPNKFEISELKSAEMDSLPEELKRFVPYACKNCGYEKKIPRRVFRITRLPKNMKEKKELVHYMKRHYGIHYFKIHTDLGATTINAGTCPRCESQYIMFDYGLFLRKPRGFE